MNRKKIWSKDTVRIWVPVLILFIVGIVLVLKYGEPPPPKHFVLATGGVGGAYYAFGQQYEQRFAKDKITIDVRATAGSIENLKLLDSEPALSATKGQADIGFVQGGVSHQVTTSHALRSLASVYYEPLWVFYRGENKIEEPIQFVGKRISIGEEGSSTQAVAKLLLDMNGVTEENADVLPMDFEKTATALAGGRIDVGFFVDAPSAAVIHRLLRTEGVHLMSFRRYSAYARKLSFLKGIVIPEGLLDFKQNIPPHDIVLLSTTATLVSRSDLHPRLVEYVLKTIRQIAEIPPSPLSKGGIEGGLLEVEELEKRMGK
ncbi:TAXI family TRAP transporter solute-binding subunit [Candidatus Poribacteria bacterium]|nr:TAXI family TRAP transporter solute-binding subunit [Candidatus Poribacteria bacterium]